MKKIASLGEAERKDLFAETAVAKGMTPMAAEKDFWICWVLMVIFEHPSLSKLLRFKGGTSLSKCFGVINRFSEDIDLILDWTVLSNVNPKQERSKSQQNKINEDMNKQAQTFINDELLPILREGIKGYCTAEIDQDDLQAINIQYKPIYSDMYLRAEVRLEIGPLAEMSPFGIYPVKSYAAEVFPEIFEQTTISVQAIKPERTFWEKITILHAEVHRPQLSRYPPYDVPFTPQQPSRYSRHYYDVYKMLGTNIERDALKNRSLLEDVVAFKSKFYPSTWAHYETATLSTMRLVPDDVVTVNLGKDYEAMKEMIFGEVPDFNDIMRALAKFEYKLHSLTQSI